MVIDFHTHVVQKYEDWDETVHQLIKDYNPDFHRNFASHMSPSGLLAQMDDAGIDYSVVLAEYAPITCGITTNQFAAQFCQHSPRLIPFASVNPYLVAHPAQKLEQEIKEYHFKGLKLEPTYVYFYPNESKIYPIYEVAAHFDIPLLVHTGSSIFKGARLKYGDPLLLDDVAVDFPQLRIIQSHGGRGFWYERAFFLAKLHQNVYIDISGLPPKNLLKYFPNLDDLSHKIIFGSDWPNLPSLKENINAIKQLPISQQAKENILYKVAANILKIELE